MKQINKILYFYYTKQIQVSHFRLEFDFVAKKTVGMFCYTNRNKTKSEFKLIYLSKIVYNHMFNFTKE